MQLKGSIEKTGPTNQVWAHKGLTFWKNMTRNEQNSRPAQTVPYEFIYELSPRIPMFDKSESCTQSPTELPIYNHLAVKFASTVLWPQCNSLAAAVKLTGRNRIWEQSRIWNLQKLFLQIHSPNRLREIHPSTNAWQVSDNKPPIIVKVSVF